MLGFGREGIGFDRTKVHSGVKRVSAGICYKAIGIVTAARVLVVIVRHFYLGALRESLLRSYLIGIRRLRKEVITTHQSLLYIWSCVQEASPPRPSPHARNNTKKYAQGRLTSLADLEHVVQDAGVYLFMPGMSF